MIKALICFCILGLLWGFIEANVLRVKHINPDQTGLKKASKPLKIVFVSDIHLDYRFKFKHHLMKRLLRKITDQKPDLIIIGGDIITKPRTVENPVFDYFKSLNIETVAVLGNHDYLDLESVIKAYQEAGIRVINNEGIEWNDYFIYGVDDYRMGSPYIKPHSHSKDVSILISHEPEVFRKNPQAQRFGFGLAGHHHGGQITLFTKYAPAVRSEFGQDMVRGFINERGLPCYISKGIGGFPLRFFATPEIVVVHLSEPS